MLFIDVRPAKADELHNAVVGVIVAIVVVSVGVTVGIVLLVKKSPTVTGCAMDSPEGLELQTEDKQVYRLLGDTASIQPGERVHVKGKKRKDKGQMTFLVEHTPKLLGSCQVAPSH